MQNISEGLIPYNHELYLTGKYIAETRGGFRPPQVVKMEGLDQPIIFVDEKKECAFVFNDGLYNYNLESEYDLFLRPKMVKKWEVVIVCDDEDKADYLYNQLTDAIVREVEVNEE